MHAEVAAYLQRCAPEARTRLEAIRAVVLEVAPDTLETFAYGMPAYKLSGRPLVYFGAFTAHIGVYPMPDAIKKFSAELEGYATSKGAIQFPLAKDLPLELIRRIVAFNTERLLEMPSKKKRA
jgi:uncharacterized protein YdhG (YjbR/CyaY superfamily)